MTVRAFAVAPMMAWTDSACRQFHRLISQRALLYTEMVTCGALIHGDVDGHLRYGSVEQPLALQLGGGDPSQLAQAVEIANPYGYREINLNVGCPSDRVQQGAIGACLMAEPTRVGRCIAAMAQATDVPVTVKCRTGIDQEAGYAYLLDFVDRLCEQAVPDAFIVHARNAWLQGLSPKQNRDIPPLKYEYVHRLKQQRPELNILINGGFDVARGLDPEFLQDLDGAMVGRDAYQNPYHLAQVDGEHAPSRAQVVEGLFELCQQRIKAQQRLWPLLRHCLGLWNGEPGAKFWRRHLSTEAIKPTAQPEVVLRALDGVLAHRTT